MLAQEFIRLKRDGQVLPDAAIAEFIQGVTSGAVTEGQVAAFAMATIFRGLSLEERVALTRAMTHSGTVIDWKAEGLNGPVLDKHSTGGVGDKVSLPLAALVAACGGFVPMISGRGLGHTGGTLDKLDSIPGYVSQPDLATLRRVVKAEGCAIIGATSDLAPADRRIYAIRDVTATVESLDLITASILSKKLAAGLDGLVMDVKFGSGAFLPPLKEAKALAESIATVAAGAGLPTVALLTDMNRVLGSTAGNALEVLESVELLAGKLRDERLWQVTRALGAEMLVLGGLAADTDAAGLKLDEALSSGRAAEVFQRMVTALGGPADFVENPQRHLAAAPLVRDIVPPQGGTVAAMDVRALGMAVVALGGGRTRPQDPIDHAVGFSHVAGPGDRVGPGAAPLLRLHARDEATAAEAERRILAAVMLDARDEGAVQDPHGLIAHRHAA